MSDKVKGLLTAVERARLTERAGRGPLWEPITIPRIVCLCGSTRFKQAYEEATLALGLAGCIVVSVAAYSHADGWRINDQQKVALDGLHLHKIDLADCVLVLNVGGYIGPSTASEIAYARCTSRPIVFLEEVPPAAA